MKILFLTDVKYLNERFEEWFQSTPGFDNKTNHKIKEAARAGFLKGVAHVNEILIAVNKLQDGTR